MTNSSLYGVILAGGSGSRLWPLSREMYPKQLLKLNDDNTFFQSTFMRLSNIMPAVNISSITGNKHATDIKLQLTEINEKIKEKEEFKVIVEPLGRNTAPAIALSIKYVLEKMAQPGEDPIILVAPSDHIIQDQEKYKASIEEGIKLAESGYIVTYGIMPTKPDTGYGYINTLEDASIKKVTSKGFKVKEFKEKPELAVAEEYCKKGTYYWNGGMFMFKASVMLKEFELYSNEIFKLTNGIDLKDEGPTVEFDDYVNMPDISIDYAIMEKSNLIALVPLESDWNDMGSWEAIYDVYDKDEDNNFISGDVINFDTKDSLIFSTSKLVSTIGLSNVVVVETDDALLVCDKNRTQDVKKVFNHLQQKDSNICKVHSTVYRPWGYYTVLNKSDNFQVKIISVNTKAKLSLQMHYHRNEHWVVLSGIAKVTKGNEEIFLKPGDSVDIPATVKHCLENPGKIELKIIETQNGSYLEEDDIVRYEDNYGRVTSSCLQ